MKYRNHKEFSYLSIVRNNPENRNDHRTNLIKNNPYILCMNSWSNIVSNYLCKEHKYITILHNHNF
jgi:hypothetical protein